MPWNTYTIPSTQYRIQNLFEQGRIAHLLVDPPAQVPLFPETVLPQIETGDWLVLESGTSVGLLSYNLNEAQEVIPGTTCQYRVLETWSVGSEGSLGVLVEHSPMTIETQWSVSLEFGYEHDYQ